MARLLFYYYKQRRTRGFTLIELMVVILFVSGFAAVGLPNLIKQASKAREVEFKNIIGTINRTQQAHHWEQEEFAQGATDAETLTILNISFSAEYIDDYNIAAYSGPDYATVEPTNPNYLTDQTRAYSGATFFDSGVYQILVCQSYLASLETPAPSPPGAPVCGPDAQTLR